MLSSSQRRREPSKLIRNRIAWYSGGTFCLSIYILSKEDFFPRMDSSPYPLWFLVLGPFLSLITVVRSGLVVYLIITRKRLHNATNWIVLSLAIADFILGAGYLPSDILLMGKWLVRHSVLSFMLSACWRLIAVFITRPLRYSILLTTKRAFLLIGAVWLASFVPHLLLHLTSSTSDPAGSLRAFDVFDIIVFEISPMLALPSFALRIFVIVRRQERRMRIQMRQVRFNRRAEPGSEMSSHNRRFCYLCETILTLYPLTTGIYAGKAN